MTAIANDGEGKAKAMKVKRIPDKATVRVIIDGTMLQTTAHLLRHGALSTVLFHAFAVFESEHAREGINDKLARYHDTFRDRDVDIQITL